MSHNQGKSSNYSNMSGAGFTSDGVSKHSVAAGMQSHADTRGGGKGLVSGLQSAGAQGHGFSGSNTSRGALDSAGFGSGGVHKASLGSNTMSTSDKSGTGGGLTSSLQSIGAKK